MDAREKPKTASSGASRHLSQRIPKRITRNSLEYSYYMDSFKRYTPIRKNQYLNRRVKFPTEEDIYICDCVCSESLINPASPTYTQIMMEDAAVLAEAKSISDSKALAAVGTKTTAKKKKASNKKKL